jgi:hypothetical protein
VFRDSRGVVHTVSAPDPLTDVPTAAASALARSLLVPVEGDLGSALERCEAAIALLERWQDAFFAGLPPEFDAEEERGFAAAAGLDYDELHQDWSDDADDDEYEDAYDDGDDEIDGQLDISGLDEVLDLDEARFLSHADDPATAALDEELVSELERELLLLPMRTRLEALIGAEAVVSDWSDLLADHEKCLGHLLLAHRTQPEDTSHEALADLHAKLHSGAAEHSP